MDLTDQRSTLESNLPIITNSDPYNHRCLVFWTFILTPYWNSLFVSSVQMSCALGVHFGSIIKQLICFLCVWNKTNNPCHLGKKKPQILLFGITSTTIYSEGTLKKNSKIFLLVVNQLIHESLLKLDSLWNSIPSLDLLFDIIYALSDHIYWFEV